MTGTAGFIALFMGIMAFWMIMAGKLGFKEYGEKLDSQLSGMIR